MHAHELSGAGLFNQARSLLAGPERARLKAMAGSASEGEGQECAQELDVKEAWVIREGANKVWLPTTYFCEGRTFLKLSKFDRGFVMFCLKKSMNLTTRQGDGQHRSANVAGFEKLLTLRREASTAAASAAMEMQEDGQKGKKRKVREADRHLVDAVVEIQTPEVQWDGHMYGGFRMKVLWGLQSKDLWAELTVSNLKYLRAVVASGQSELIPRKRASPKKRGRRAQPS